MWSFAAVGTVVAESVMRRLAAVGGTALVEMVQWGEDGKCWWCWRWGKGQSSGGTAEGTAGIDWFEERTDLAVGQTRFDQGQGRPEDRRSKAAAALEAAAAVAAAAAVIVVVVEPEAAKDAQHQWSSHSTQAVSDDIPVRDRQESALPSVDERAVRQAAPVGGRSLAVEPTLVEMIPPGGDAAEAATGPADWAARSCERPGLAGAMARNRRPDAAEPHKAVVEDVPSSEILGDILGGLGTGAIPAPIAEKSHAGHGQPTRTVPLDAPSLSSWQKTARQPLRWSLGQEQQL